MAHWLLHWVFLNGAPMAQWRIVSGKIPTSSLQIAPRVIRAARSLVRPGRGPVTATTGNAVVRSDANFVWVCDQSGGGAARPLGAREGTMTRPIPFTKARLRRAIEAAREAGLRVTGIRPDGTLIVDDNPQASENPIEQEREVVL
jgi:hypothetical protein